MHKNREEIIQMVATFVNYCIKPRDETDMRPQQLDTAILRNSLVRRLPAYICFLYMVFTGSRSAIASTLSDMVGTILDGRPVGIVSPVNSDTLYDHYYYSHLWELMAAELGRDIFSLGSELTTDETLRTTGLSLSQMESLLVSKSLRIGNEYWQYEPGQGLLLNRVIDGEFVPMLVRLDQSPKLRERLAELEQIYDAAAGAGSRIMYSLSSPDSDDVYPELQRDLTLSVQLERALSQTVKARYESKQQQSLFSKIHSENTVQLTQAINALHANKPERAVRLRREVMARTVLEQFNALPESLDRHLSGNQEARRVARDRTSAALQKIAEHRRSLIK